MEEVAEVGGVESEVLGVLEAGDAVGGLQGGGDVGDVDVDVVGDAVGAEAGGHEL